MNTYWKFSRIDNIEECSFNSSLERFYDYGISGCVKENIQNSLDAKKENKIKINIELGSMNTDEIPGIKAIKKRIDSLEFKNDYARKTIEHMKQKSKQENCNYISFEDCHTKGLKYKEDEECSWNAYAYKRGNHYKSRDEKFEEIRGGSYGIGKIASNAASDLYLMYFSNCDDLGNKHIGGTVQLIDHNIENICYRGTGYYTNEDGRNNYIPFLNNIQNDIFKKDRQGLKIIIPYLREQFKSTKEIIRVICDNFLIAILEEKLIIEINQEDNIYEINKNTIKNYIEDEYYYEVQNISDIKKEFTPLYLKTYQNIEPIDLEIEDKNKAIYRFKLYLNYNENIKKSRVAIIRTIGMKIEDKKIKSCVNRPFNGVLIPCSSSEDKFLKSLENESHSKIGYEHIKSKLEQDNAKRFINNIDKKIKAEMDKIINEKNPTDGSLNTEDIIYTIENNFKKALTEKKNLVKLSGNKKAVKTKVSIKPKTKKDKCENRRENSVSKKNKAKLYRVEPNFVDRIIAGGFEHIQINISAIKVRQNIKKCNIKYITVDGMGEEYEDEFDIKSNYEYIIDKVNNNKLKFTNNIIENASINNGYINIKLKTKANFDRTSKFIYVVEV